ncbi:hypothetical protein CEP52_017653 [Fusarium oligoseptatum]|uniref:Uncharacterized protein n=1 Tax=Fusarium oligoseptatum TaxID=2604345 RepID=A0A428RKY3_9HYPO|nr:hypothetical protein CEP52_017653 [Fusarium oligoseptatum]
MALASGEGHEAVVRLLLEKGADPNLGGVCGWIPLSQAVQNGHEAVVRLLCENGANPDLMDGEGCTPLGQAAQRGHKAVMRLLLEKSTDIDPKDDEGCTPLAQAARNGHEAVMEQLLEKGANPNTTDRSGWTPLSHAAQNGHEAAVRLLLEKGADPSSGVGDGCDSMLLSQATRQGHGPEDAAGQPVYTSNDLAMFTHVIYLNIPINVISQRRLDDGLKVRTAMSQEHLGRRKEEEESTMRDRGHKHHNLFSAVSNPEALLPRVVDLTLQLQQPITAVWLAYGLNLMEFLLLLAETNLETVLVMDGDKTPAAEDTSALFWEIIAQTRPSLAAKSPLQELFGSPLGYSDTAFHQATLLYEEAIDNE